MSRDRDQRIAEYIRKDPFARFLGAEVEIVKPGHSRVSLTITENMLNFHGATHGGVIFALGDMAFAAASNSRGQTAVALNVGINFLKATGAGDHLVAEAVEQAAAGPTALYDISIRNAQTGELVAKSQDLVYRKKEWFVPDTKI
ncbi:MAG: hotdog fold thioesterase [Desulfobacterales bacterium]|nr:hotdog fold thioesterase [Desulfobacterales bacterium]